MNLYLIGHDYRYAAEQMLLTLFPDERPVYPDGRPTGDRAELRLMSGAKVTTATCVLVYQGRTANGRTSVPNEELTDPNETDRRLQGAVKRAFYRNSKLHILLCDSTKFGKQYFFNLFTLHEIDYIVTDKRPVNSALVELMGDRLIYPEE